MPRARRRRLSRSTSRKKTVGWINRRLASLRDPVARGAHEDALGPNAHRQREARPFAFPHRRRPPRRRRSPPESRGNSWLARETVVLSSTATRPKLRAPPALRPHGGCRPKSCRPRVVPRPLDAHPVPVHFLLPDRRSSPHCSSHVSWCHDASRPCISLWGQDPTDSPDSADHNETDEKTQSLVSTANPPSCPRRRPRPHVVRQNRRQQSPLGRSPPSCPPTRRRSPTHLPSPHGEDRKTLAD